MERFLRGFFWAWTLLSRIPLPYGLGSGPPAAGIAVFFPIVGILFGLGAWAVYTGIRTFLPEGPARALVLVAWYLLSGGLHLDGFADTVDAWGGGGTREEVLRIMRDPHVGALGVAGVVLLLVVKIAALWALPSRIVGPALVVIGATGRWAPVYAAWRYPSARREGLGSVTREGIGVFKLVVATGVVALASGTVAGSVGLLGSAVGMGAAILGALAIARWLGGHTGDTYGFLVEVTEVVVLLALAGVRAPSAMH
ncbi:MAG: adenosylcobinamide-GDP ribazoletransferase [Armatimonadota bacterium]|nr:adenosylcobinamide-GDP ribazoletransferase [Armatimonadota bacterium]MDR5702767.1 adenosylcobinamide-GDP ribazoletransferase [Armatimonadota bacterium]